MTCPKKPTKPHVLVLFVVYRTIKDKCSPSEPDSGGSHVLGVLTCHCLFQCLDRGRGIPDPLLPTRNPVIGSRTTLDKQRSGPLVVPRCSRDLRRGSVACLGGGPGAGCPSSPLLMPLSPVTAFSCPLNHHSNQRFNHMYAPTKPQCRRRFGDHGV